MNNKISGHQSWYILPMQEIRAFLVLIRSGFSSYIGGDVRVLHNRLATVFSLLRLKHDPPVRKVGMWKDYLYGECIYIVLSLMAKTVPAWQVFAGTLRPV